MVSRTSKFISVGLKLKICYQLSPHDGAITPTLSLAIVLFTRMGLKRYILGTFRSIFVKAEKAFSGEVSCKNVLL